MLGALDLSAEEIAVYDDVIRRFGESKEAALQEQVAKALVNKGITLGILNRRVSEIAVYEDVIRRFEESKEVALQEQAAKALFNKGVALGALIVLPKKLQLTMRLSSASVTQKKQR